MKNNKPSTKVFNAINLFLVCAMIITVIIVMIEISLETTSFPVYAGLVFGLIFTIPLTIINVIRFIVEGIKTFNNDSLASGKDLTKGKKALKMAFSVVNVLLICAMVIHVGIEIFPTSNVKEFFVMFLYSSFYLVPFVIVNTVKFIIFGNKDVFEENYKKPFKTVFIGGNILLLCAMIIHIIISVISNFDVFNINIILSPVLFYSFLLAVFDGIKFIIDDIKSLLHKSDKTDKN